MGQPVKLSDELVCDARASAEITQRSIAGQVRQLGSMSNLDLDPTALEIRSILAAFL